MKPAFALSLSFEGISLLHRAVGGWRLVGSAALDAPDLVAELAALRKKASRLESEPLCKLVLPNDQIRYIDVETGGFEGEARKHIIEGAVDSATPYDIEDLVYDAAPMGEMTHVAAVARETLNEAEAFATQHGFVPVSFVAIPADNSFPGEPFFGPSQIAQGWTGSQAIEPDSSAVVDIGPVTLPEPVADDDADWEIGGAADHDGGEDRAAIDDETPEEAVAAEELSSPSLAEAPADPLTPEEPTPYTVADPPPDPEPSETAGSLGPTAQAKQPRRLGLILTVALLAVLVLVGIWASLFLEDPISSLFRSQPQGEETEIALDEAVSEPAPDDITAEPPAPVAPPAAEADTTDRLKTEMAALIETLPAPVEVPALSDTDDAVLEALASEPLEDPATQAPEILDTEELYQETGLWSETPEEPEVPGLIALDDLFVASIDRTDLSQDPVALPPAAQNATDLPVSVRSRPATAGAGFDLDERGLVEPTPEGTRNPDGILIVLGKPPKLPPETPLRFEQTPEVDETRDVLAQKRPRNRPDNLIELNERARLGGRTLAELAGVRPKARPESLQVKAAVEEVVAAAQVLEPIDPIPRPRLRPAGLSGRQQQTANLGSLANLDKQTPVRTVAPKVVKPSRPSPTSVARQATVKNAINLRKVSLIGVFGTPSDRRALVRMGNGRYKKVKIGDRIDGGRVVAIGDSELLYQKGGRNLSLKMPKG